MTTTTEGRPDGPDGDEAGAPGERRNHRGALLRVGASLLLLSIVLQRAEPAEIFKAIAGVHPGWLAASFALHLVGYALSALRWQGLLAARGRVIGALKLGKAILVGTFFNFFLPTTVGGDIVRAGEEAEISAVPLTESLGVVAMDRLTGVVSLLALALAASVAGMELAEEGAIFWASSVLGVVAVGLTVIFVSGPLLARLEGVLPPFLARPAGKVIRMLAVFRSLAAAPPVAGRALLVSLVFHCNVIVHYIFIARALDIETPAMNFFVIVPVVAFLLQIPFSLNGIGYREGGFALMLGGVGVGAGKAVALAWLDFAMVLTLGLCGGLLFLLRGGRLPAPLVGRFSLGRSPRRDGEKA